MLSIDVEAKIGGFALKAKLPAAKGTTVIVGPNGAGKSTLLRVILGELQPVRGRICLGERVLLDVDLNLRVPTEERRLGYVPQNYALFPHMTVAQNVAFGLRCKGSAQGSRVKELLKELHIEHLASRKTSVLSGGESQRVALARALATDPKALLLDEPTAALDSDARRKVRRFLAERLRVAGIPTIIVSHDIQDAVVLADQVAVLENGSIVQVGTLEELRANPASSFVEQFVVLDGIGYASSGEQVPRS